MATKVSLRTTYEPFRVIEPIYTGGEVSSNATGNLLATIVENDVLVVETKTGRPLIRIDGDDESVTSLCLSPGAAYLIICSRSLSMRIYGLSNIDGGISAQLLRTLKPHTSPVVSSTVDHTDSLLVTGGADGIVKVWDIRRGHCSHIFHGHGGLVTAVEVFEFILPNLKRHSSNGKQQRNLKIQNEVMHDDSSGRTFMVAAGGEDGRIKVWDLNTRKDVATLESHVSVVRSISWSAEQRLLLSASRDRTLVLWDANTWHSKKVIPALETLEISHFLENGIYLFAAGENGRLRLWRTETGEELTDDQRPGFETQSIVSAVSIPTLDAILTVHLDQSMVLHSLTPLKTILPTGRIPPLPILRRISGNHDEIIDMACVGPQRDKLALANNTESIKIITLDEKNEGDLSFGSDVDVLEGHQDIIICIDVDWSGHWLATGAKDNTARLWRIDPASSLYECFATFSGHAESLGAIALPKSPLPGHPSSKAPLAFPPAYLITGSQDKTIKKWDISKLSIETEGSPHNIAKAVFTRVAHEKDINAIDISPIAPLFASASQDKTIKVWSIEDGSTTGILRGHKRGVWSIQFSPAGTPAVSLSEGGQSGLRGLIISGSGDRTVKVWSLSTYTCLATFEGHSNSVLKVIWIPPPSLKLGDKGSEEYQQPTQSQRQPIIASASSDTLVKLWNPYAAPDTDHLLATLDNHTDRVWSLAVPSSTLPSTNTEDIGPKASYSLISGAADATLTFWKDTTTQTAEAHSKHLTERIEQEQLLQNHMYAHNYRESITLAIRLNHPGRLLKILEEVVNLPDSQKESNSLMGVKEVDNVLKSLTQEDLYRLLERIRDWNTNARTAVVAQKVLNTLLRSYSADTWTKMAKNQRKFVFRDKDAERGSAFLQQGRKQQSMGMRDLFRALEAYTERHYKRMEELLDESYMLDYTLREMDEVAGTSIPMQTNGNVHLSLNGKSKHLINGNSGVA